MRYAKLKPDAEIPNDLYNYHLRKLVSDGIVEKTHQKATHFPSRAGAMLLTPIIPATRVIDYSSTMSCSS